MESECKKTAGKSVAWWLIAAVLFSLPCVAACWLFFRYAGQTIHVVFAYDQTGIFEEMRDKCLRATDPSEGAYCLEYTMDYYPSGSKQEKGSWLDHIVERARRSAIREMIAHLRTLTGLDLGNDPAVWIAKFKKPN
jgi:hypothetical protein